MPNNYKSYKTHVHAAWWTYNISDNSYPKIKRCCAIYETKGDRRLGDHVIIGLEKLLECFLPDFETSRLQEKLNSRIDGTSILETWVILLDDDKGENLIDLVNFPLGEEVPKHSPRYKQMCCLANWNYSSLSNPLKLLWESCIDTLLNGLPLSNILGNSHPQSLFGYIFWLLGREVGVVQRVLYENSISWGTYDDLLGFHCNAHPNNLILLRVSNFNT